MEDIMGVVIAFTIVYIVIFLILLNENDNNKK